MTRQEFIGCVERSQKSLRRFLVSVCSGDVSLAEDLAQESYLKAYMASGNFNNKDVFTSWILKIGYNTFLNYLRAQRPNIPIEEAKGFDSGDRSDDSFKYENLYQALEDLPVREKSAIVLYYLEGYSTKEISEILEINDEAVRQGLSRGRKRLKSLLM